MNRLGSAKRDKVLPVRGEETCASVVVRMAGAAGRAVLGLPEGRGCACRVHRRREAGLANEIWALVDLV